MNDVGIRMQRGDNASIVTCNQECNGHERDHKV
jgi:hypothetical protein